MEKKIDAKKKREIEETKRFKESYFSRCDDIKSHTHNVYDW